MEGGRGASEEKDVMCRSGGEPKANKSKLNDLSHSPSLEASKLSRSSPVMSFEPKLAL